ncbi:unnamed protein product [Microthlaspi erraticum]|uniref:RNase H type-1 domain-containing protein n=1 Tax=Microthlaspi erraticum TaxID=1685480 RepID=A0A6D2LNF8_9BRAS|nr:unnamed protein product [Microthlaspi erraticum]
MGNSVELSFKGEICQIDGSWKDTDPRAGLELEALVWAMQCMLRQNKLTIVFETDCSDVVKMVSKPEEWPAFATILEEFCRCKTEFISFSIVHISRKQNTKADKLARSARALPTDVYYVNSVPPTWIPELI